MKRLVVPLVVCLAAWGVEAAAKGVPLETPVCAINPDDAAKLPALYRMIYLEDPTADQQTILVYIYTGQLVGPSGKIIQQRLAEARGFSTSPPARFLGSKSPFPQAHAYCVAMREQELRAACQLKDKLLALTDLPAASHLPVAIRIGLMPLPAQLYVSLASPLTDWGVPPRQMAQESLNSIPDDRAGAADMVHSVSQALEAGIQSDDAEAGVMNTMTGRTSDNDDASREADLRDFGQQYVAMMSAYHQAFYDAIEQYDTCVLRNNLPPTIGK